MLHQRLNSLSFESTITLKPHVHAIRLTGVPSPDVGDHWSRLMCVYIRDHLTAILNLWKWGVGWRGEVKTTSDGRSHTAEEEMWAHKGDLNPARVLDTPCCNWQFRCTSVTPLPLIWQPGTQRMPLRGPHYALIPAIVLRGGARALPGWCRETGAGAALTVCLWSEQSWHAAEARERPGGSRRMRHRSMASDSTEVVLFQTRLFTASFRVNF